MKRSIKVAALALFATSLLGGCSSGGPAEQKISVEPSSLKVYVGESFTLESNTEKATWSLEENEIGATLSAVEGKSTMVSATMAGTVVAVAKANGYTTPKVTLTFELRNQQISVSPASLETFVDDTFTLTSNVDETKTVNWTLEPNSIGAALSASTGKTVSVSAISAGTVVAVANAEGYAESRVTLKFNELLPQNISSNPASGEEFVGRTITVTTDAESAAWTLSENTAGASLDSASGKSVTVSATQIGEVVITAEAKNRQPASMRLSFVAPHWTDDEKAQMREVLHGEVLPYAEGAGILSFQVAQGMARIMGGSISGEDLAAYAAQFSESEGWVAQETSEEPSIYEYAFEKCISTEEGNRYVYVNFASINDAGEGVEGGDFALIAYDPYIYEFPSANFELAKITLEIESEVEVPAMPADHYYFNEKYAAALCYGFEEGVDPEEAYTAILTATEDFYVYGYDSVLDVCVAEEKTGAFSLFYFLLDDGGLGIQLEKGYAYEHEWPAELLGQYCALVLGSETVVPAFEASRYYSQYNSKYNVVFVECYDFESEDPISDYAAILEEAGWTYFGLFGSASTGQYGMADSPDGKVGVQFQVEDGIFTIVVSENNFDHVFPTLGFAAALAEEKIETEVEVPAIAAGGYYFFSDEDGTGVYCYKLVSEEEDGGYSAILAAAGWDIFRNADEETGQVFFNADSPDHLYGLQYVYFAEEEVLAIYLDDTYRYYDSEWPDNYAMLISVLVFSSESVLPDPEVEATEYIIDWDYAMFICEGVVSEEPDAGYSAKLEAAGFTLLGVKGEEGEEYYAANAGDSAYGVAYWYEDGTLYIQFTDPFPIELDEFPHDEIVANFAEFGVEGVELPSFTIASEEGYFELDPAALASGAYVLYANGATSEEYSAYVAALEAAGWVIVEDEEEGRDYPSELVLQYGETYAFVQIMDLTEEYDCVAMAFYYEEPKITDFPEKDILDFLAKSGFEGELPLVPYSIAAQDGYYEEEVYSSSLYIYANNSTAEEQAAYINALLEAGWVISKPGTESWPLDVTMTYGDTGVYVYLSDYESSGYIMLKFWYEEPLPTEYPAEEIAADLAAAGVKKDSLPQFAGNAAGYYYSTSSGHQLQILLSDSSAAAEELAAYQALLLASGYTEAGEDSFGDMHYASPNGELDVCPWIGSGGYLVIDIEVQVAVPFPSEKINADLASLGLEDTLPAYTGEATWYGWYFEDDAIQLSFTVADEDGAVEQYQADLLAAGYSEAGEDSYGDMHYTSPNGELDVCVWHGSDIGYSGYVFVDVAVNEGGGSVVEEFPLEEVNAFLEENSFGFQLTSALVDPSSEGYSIEYYSNGGYPVCDITVSGDAYEEDYALLSEILLAAGYEVAYEEEGFVYFVNDNDTSVVIYLDAETGTTLVSFTA